MVVQLKIPEDIRCVLIVRDHDQIGTLLGIITDGDLRRHMAPDLLGQAARAVMTAGPKTIDADALAAEALGYMNRERITGIFVTEADRPVGFIHVHDLLQAGIM